MFNWFRSSKPSIESMTNPLPRSVLLQRGRIAILDDEEPEMLTDLRNGGFAVTHIVTYLQKFEGGKALPRARVEVAPMTP